MELKILNPSTVRFHLSPHRCVDVMFYGVEARIMAFGLEDDGRRIPTSLFENEIEGFVKEARKTLQQGARDNV